MKSKIREKVIASVMLGAFFATNMLGTVAFAYDDYGYGEGPALRSGGSSSLTVVKPQKINNANSIVNLSLRDADVTQVLRMFADQAGMNIIFSPSVSGNVTMDLVNITLEEALNLVVKTSNIAYDIKNNTLIVYGSGEDMDVADKEMAVVPVKYVSPVAIANFLNKNIFSKNSLHPGVSSKPVVVVNSASNELLVMGTAADAEITRRIVEKFDKKPTVTTFKVNHTTPAEMANLVCKTLLPQVGSKTGGAAPISGVATGFASDSSSSSSKSSSSSSSSKSGSSSGGGGGGAGSGITVGGGSIACSIGDTAGVTADGYSSFDMRNLSVIYFPTLGTVQVVGGSEGQIEMIREFIAASDKKAPQAYLEVQIVSLSESGSKQLENSWTFMSHAFSFNAGGSHGFGTPTNYPIFFAGHGFTQESGSGSSATSTELKKWSSSPQLVYQVNYLVTNDKGRMLANPKILMTNGQKSTIDLSSDYVQSVTTQYLDSGFTSQVQRQYDIGDDNGITVEITPFISPDGYVTLDITPDYASIKEQLTVLNPQTQEREIQATLLQRQNLELKGVRIKDGETLVIGGMIRETETKSVQKIPFLGDIPALGVFFRSTVTRREKEELIIMITPQIVVDTEDAQAQEKEITL